MTTMQTKPPLQHLAVIMDGNGRWAQQRGLPRTTGHKAGIKSVRCLIEACEEFRIEYLTLFAFSSENWKRPRKEVGMLMDLFFSTLDSEISKLVDQGIRLQFIGDLSAFDARLQTRMQEATAATKKNGRLKLNIAVNYGGRLDITLAARQLACDVSLKKIAVDEITSELFGRYVSLSDFPEPDLLIRTGGECRISNFLLWQMAYTELYFTETLWPDFDKLALHKAVEWFSGRERRFGETSEQAQARLKPLQHA